MDPPEIASSERPAVPPTPRAASGVFTCPECGSTLNCETRELTESSGMADRVRELEEEVRNGGTNHSEQERRILALQGEIETLKAQLSAPKKQPWFQL
jgi:hypothetical protein